MNKTWQQDHRALSQPMKALVMLLWMLTCMITVPVSIIAFVLGSIALHVARAWCAGWNLGARMFYGTDGW